MSRDPSCLLCDLPEKARAGIDHILADKGTAAQVNTYLRHSGLAEVHRNTVSKHRNRHNLAFVRRKAVEMKETVKELGAAPIVTNQDLAVLARNRGVERLLDPNDSLDVSMAEALRAQEIIDKRAQRGSDQDFMLQLGRILSGAVQGVVPEYVDAEWREEREADEREMRLLQAGE